jgi:hypothetical protein
MFEDQPTPCQKMNIEARRPRVLVFSDMGYKFVLDGNPLEVAYYHWCLGDGADEPRGTVDLGDIS